MKHLFLIIQVGWGFFAHELINEMAIYSLPQPIFHFYRSNLGEIKERATKADMRRYVLKDEASRHFMDLDQYLDIIPVDSEAFYDSLRYDTLQEHGKLGWHLEIVCYQLIKAFRNQNRQAIINLSADLGHYAADAQVPLHTTSNYNGQQTDQHGIHGLWETRLPELYHSQYELWSDGAQYLPDRSAAIWESIHQSALAADSVLHFEKIASNLHANSKYSYEERNKIINKVYSKEFCHSYHQMLSGQVERQLLKSIELIANLWYTCWVEAGQPPL